MSRILLTAVLLAMTPAASLALPVNPLPDASAFDRRPAGYALLAETSRGCATDLENCASARALLIEGRSGTADARAIDFEKARAALLLQKGYVLGALDDEEAVFEGLEEELLETPLPAAAFPMLLGLVGAAIALRLKKIA
jgi:hypothetical protein